MYKITKEENELAEELYDKDGVFQTEKMDEKEILKYYDEQERLRKLKEEEAKK